MSHYKKYARTFHLPWSHLHSDDKSLSDLSVFEGKEIVVTEKLDGENTTIYPDGYLHARSLDSQHNFTRDWAKRMASVLCHEMPEGMRFVFENVSYAHSIHYKNLESFCYLLSIWTDDDFCLSFDDTMEYSELLDLATPYVFYRGFFDKSQLLKISDELDIESIEGYVFRNVDSFHQSDFENNVGKFVRTGHVQPDTHHWLKTTYPNEVDFSKKLKPFYMFKQSY